MIIRGLGSWLRKSAAPQLFAILPVILSLRSWAEPVHLRCEYLQNPIGIDQPVPHLSWQSDNTERNWKQSAYQILIAGSTDALAAGRGDVWDSGKVISGDSV